MSNIKKMISSWTATFFEANTGNDALIQLEGKKFEIPVFQRPYSWGEHQVTKLISDLFMAFQSSNGNPIEDVYFIGTMQLSVKNDVYEVIDGQQRLSTFLLLMKVLSEKESMVSFTFPFDFLSTKVNGGSQQELLQDFREQSKGGSLYEENAKLIGRLLEEKKEGADFEVCWNDFRRFICSQVVFIVIETTASLSKQLQIFPVQKAKYSSSSCSWHLSNSDHSF